MRQARTLSSLWLALWDKVRADHWWHYKLAPAAAVVYATALAFDVPLSRLWPAAATVVLALIPAAAYVSVINDLTDHADDRAAGKRNRFAGASRRQSAAFVGGTFLGGACFVVIWRADGVLLVLYLATWLAFSLYSLPPFRWKTRGALGLIADASGAHLFPSLLAAVLAFRAADMPLDPLWLSSLGVWSLCFGLRGIMWHQLSDLEHDRAAGVNTFANAYGPLAADRLGTLVVFPIEMIAFVFVLAQAGSLWPLAFLAAYGYLAVERSRQWGLHLIIVRPRLRYDQILMREYYDTFLPVALIVASAVRQPLVLTVLCVHALVFARTSGSFVDMWHFTRTSAGRARLGVRRLMRANRDAS
jgi:4-hydroxybenzoate polyprenyltransferase